MDLQLNKLMAIIFKSCFIMKEIITMESGANKQIHTQRLSLHDLVFSFGQVYFDFFVISSIFDVRRVFMPNVQVYNLFIRTSING